MGGVGEQRALAVENFARQQQKHAKSLSQGLQTSIGLGILIRLGTSSRFWSSTFGVLIRLGTSSRFWSSTFGVLIRLGTSSRFWSSTFGVSPHLMGLAADTHQKVVGLDIAVQKTFAARARDNQQPCQRNPERVPLKIQLGSADWIWRMCGRKTDNRQVLRSCMLNHVV